MALPREAYQMLETIVGQENVSEEPAILESYSFYFMQELARRGTGTRLSPWRPSAVILPGSTKEVQDIIKVCNRFKIKSKAQSSGWGPWDGYAQEDTLIIDLRRMNRIIEIDSKNRYAVVEPYVSWAQLHAEVMKLGLTLSMAGVGCHCSVLANYTSGFGMGPGNWSMGVTEKNLLGVEWILPDGEVLKLGSLGSGDGWFCGDGPGLSLRGLLRGEYGAMGGLGVVTKCGVRLYHWPGPPVMPIEGILPDTRLTELPENIKTYLFTFSSLDKQTDFLYQLGRAEIGRFMYCTGYGALVGCVPQLRKYIPLNLGGSISDEVTTWFILACNSPREMEYQEKVLNAIVAETDAKVPDFWDDPLVKATIFRYLIRPDYVFNYFYGFSGGGFLYLSDYIGSPDAIATLHKRVNESAKPWEGKGLLPGCTDATFQPMYDYAHAGYLDGSGSHWDPADPETLKEYGHMMKDITSRLDPQIERPSIGTKYFNEKGGPTLSNYHIWQKRIKRVFDPNYVSDASYYMDPE